MVRNSYEIKGIKIINLEHELSQFANDTTFILNGSSNSLNQALEVLLNFAHISGLSVNFDKTKVIWIGINK
jgi:competence transcription factor ComK